MSNFAGGGGASGGVTDVVGGTTNKLPKFSSSTVLADSSIGDDGTIISTLENMQARGFQNGGQRIDLSVTTTNQVQFGQAVNVAWTSGTLASGTTDTFLSRSGVGGLRIGTTLNGSDGVLSCATEALSGKITTYNGIATVTNGVPSLVATVDTTGLTANVSAVTVYAVPSSGAGLYRISSYVTETTAGSITSTLPNLQILYTDNDSNTAITMDGTPVLGVAGVGQTGALTANTVGTTSTGVVVVNAKASTNIQYQTVNYASNAAGMTYAVHVRIEAI